MCVICVCSVNLCRVGVWCECVLCVFGVCVCISCGRMCGCVVVVCVCLYVRVKCVMYVY